MRTREDFFKLVKNNGFLDVILFEHRRQACQKICTLMCLFMVMPLCITVLSFLVRLYYRTWTSWNSARAYTSPASQIRSHSRHYANTKFVSSSSSSPLAFPFPFPRLTGSPWGCVHLTWGVLAGEERGRARTLYCPLDPKDPSMYPGSCAAFGERMRDKKIGQDLPSLSLFPRWSWGL